MTTDTKHDQELKHLIKLIKDIKTAMLTTIKEDGDMHSRPMVTQELDEKERALWFFTGQNSPKVDEIQQDQKVLVNLVDTSSDVYVTISGHADVVHDREKIRELWNPVYKAWFPKGVDDPNLVLLKVTIEQAEYWDVSSGTMLQLFGFIKSLATGEPLKPETHKINFPK